MKSGTVSIPFPLPQGCTDGATMTLRPVDTPADWADVPEELFTIVAPQLQIGLGQSRFNTVEFKRTFGWTGTVTIPTVDVTTRTSGLALPIVRKGEDGGKSRLPMELVSMTYLKYGSAAIPSTADTAEVLFAIGDDPDVVILVLKRTSRAM